MTTQLSRIPFPGAEIYAAEIDGEPHVALRPACEAIGITYGSQYNRLQRQPWAVVSMTKTTGADGKTYEMAMLNRKTFTMWLATIETSRVKNDSARNMVVTFQKEAADALDRYFHEGGAINPRATEDQLEGIAALANQQMQVLTLAKGLIDADWLSAKAKIVASRALGETPQIDSDELPLYVEDFLKEKGMSTAQAKALRSPFGKKLSQAHLDFYGYRPAKAPANVGGRPREVNAYTGKDRFLFERTWREHFAPLFDQTLLAVI